MVEQGRVAQRLLRLKLLELLLLLLLLLQELVLQQLLCLLLLLLEHEGVLLLLKQLLLVKLLLLLLLLLSQLLELLVLLWSARKASCRAIVGGSQLKAGWYTPVCAMASQLACSPPAMLAISCVGDNGACSCIWPCCGYPICCGGIA